MHGFKSAILAIFPFCQSGTFEPVHEIQKIFLPKDFFRGIMQVPFTKNIHNFFQGQSNPGFRSVKVQTEFFLKKDSRDSKNSFQFRFLWIPSKAGEQNQKALILLWFIIVERQCGIWCYKDLRCSAGLVGKSAVSLLISRLMTLLKSCLHGRLSSQIRAIRNMQRWHKKTPVGYTIYRLSHQYQNTSALDFGNFSPTYFK